MQDYARSQYISELTLSELTVEIIAQAKENLIQRRETHLDQLADKLKEDRVFRVIHLNRNSQGNHHPLEHAFRRH